MYHQSLIAEKLDEKRAESGGEEVEKSLPDVSKLTCIGFNSRNDPKVGLNKFFARYEDSELKH